MTLTERMDYVAEQLKVTKDNWVAQSPENTSLAIYIHFYREEEMVAMVQAPLDLDHGLMATQLGAVGFNATSFVFTFDGYHTELKVSPLSGKPWQHREMQYVVETVPDAFEKGWISECHNTSAYDRDGNWAARFDPYLVKEDRVIWSVPTRLDQSGDRQGGKVGQVLSTVLKRKSALDLVHENEAEDLMNMLSVERQFFHMDMATLLALKERKLATNTVLLAAEGTERAELIEARGVSGDPFGFTPE